MQRIEGNLYDYPQYYDLVFGSDWSAEVAFLKGCFDRYLSGATKKLFEPACGTGRLLFRLAGAGFEVSGLDLNEKAVAYCNERLTRAGYPASTWVGDMTDFRLPSPVDAAFNTINSFRHLNSEAAALSHLKCMAAALRPGGIYVLGLHLSPTAAEPTEEESWSARRGHLAVNTHMWTLERDLSKRTERFAMTFDVYTPTRRFQLYDELNFRTYTAAQFRRLVGKTGNLEIAGVYDFAYDLNDLLELTGEVEDAVFILKKLGK